MKLAANKTKEPKKKPNCQTGRPPLPAVFFQHLPTDQIEFPAIRRHKWVLFILSTKDPIEEKKDL
jgi:hypothetical protein